MEFGNLVSVNSIGAFVITLLLFAALRHRPPIQKWERVLIKAPLSLRFCLVSYLTLLTIFAVADARNLPSPFFLLQLPNVFLLGIITLIHEAGHFYLSWAGDFLHVAGGSIMQIASPIAISFLLYKKRCLNLAAFVMWWMGEGMLGLSTYIADAETQKLFLLGGGEHDWHYIFEQVGSISLARPLGWITWVAALCICIVSMLYILVANGSVRENAQISEDTP